MNRTLARLALALGALALIGPGCLSFRGGGRGDVFSVWKSVDGGVEWHIRAAYPTPQGVGDLSAVEVNELVMDPSDRFTLYSGSIANGLLYTYDAADGWTRPRENYLREGRVRAIAVDANDKCTLYVSRGQKLAKSTDCGRTFDTEVYVDPRSDVVITDVEVDWFNGNTVYLVNSVGEVIKSTDAAGSWTTIYRKGGFARDIELSNADSRVLILATAKKGMHRSGDGGQTWNEVLNNNLEAYRDLDGVENVNDVGQTKAGDALWASTEYGLIRSGDNGQTWNTVPLITPPSGVGITALAVDPRDGNHVMYVTGSTIYSTVNGGTRWETEQMPVVARAFQLIIDPEQSQTVYMGLRSIEEIETLF